MYIHIYTHNWSKVEFSEIQIDFQKNIFKVFLLHTWVISIQNLVSIGLPIKGVSLHTDRFTDKRFALLLLEIILHCSVCTIVLQVAKTCVGLSFGSSIVFS